MNNNLKNANSISDELREFINKWKNKPGNLIMILHRVQEEYGYISKDIVLELSKILNVSLAKVYGVATFYHFFKLEKPGKHSIAVCTGTACYLKGSGEILEELERILDVKVGNTTVDNEFSLEAVRCIGCCGLAPVMTVDNEVYGKVDKKQLRKIIAKYKQTEIATQST
ncbi:MAG: NADH dehydrogenase [Candidatus Melainabacteria bacterium RIFOXYA12_FULL_32_12]|nr:MAG: NADH dehydrogenase [Candidatus Melainabacteria bacterium RIFOXYA12_FULL_32_12]